MSAHEWGNEARSLAADARAEATRSARMASNPERERLLKELESAIQGADLLADDMNTSGFDTLLDCARRAAALLRGPSEQEAQSREAPWKDILEGVAQAWEAAVAKESRKSAIRASYERCAAELRVASDMIAIRVREAQPQATKPDADWLKATCERLEDMGYVVVGRNEWERVVPQFIERFPPHVRALSESQPASPAADTEECICSPLPEPTNEYCPVHGSE